MPELQGQILPKALGLRYFLANSDSHGNRRIEVFFATK